MDVNQESLKLHEELRGKIEVVARRHIETRDDLSLLYTPGVAEPCREIAKDPAAAYTYTAKGNLVAVVTNGTAVLGLGDIGAAAAMPVMEGKAILFKEFGGVDAFPICLDTKDPEQVIEAVRLLARLEKEYPRGDMRPQATAMRQQMAPAAADSRLADASAGKGKAVRVNNVVAGQPGLSVQRVFIDAGHGGRDPGTIHNDVIERNITLDIALRLGRLLEDNGLEVIYSRRKDVAVSLRDRTGKANQAGADLFVSIHVNAHEDRGINGFETYYLDISRDPRAVRVASQENARNDRNLGEVQKILSDGMLTARQYESRRLGTDIQKQSLARLKRRGYTVRDNGTRAAPFIVLLGARMPCVLVEVGYCSNPHEARNLLDARYRMILAEGLAEGILSYSDRVRQNRTAQNSLTPPASGAM